MRERVRQLKGEREIFGYLQRFYLDFLVWYIFVYVFEEIYLRLRNELFEKVRGKNFWSQKV